MSIIWAFAWVFVIVLTSAFITFHEVRRRTTFTIGDVIVHALGCFARWAVAVHRGVDKGLKEYRIVKREMGVEMTCREGV